ncbi:hypothetical protein CERSUDRAFT_94227 [Gelatoporia subvermispora B]|uniref:Uncharacterized protein n=1 Tax=Ceriporiopsis subvermispora (strain B) TaxID=914234 RepID=M2R2C9_CERS8|nr:hypothetical protein CERSUDRAFT_94227 [Gelatoporia subvermispora B]
MPFCVQVPQLAEDEEFAYHSDGMLGQFELLKWPQVYDQLEPHLMAAPVHPGSRRRYPDAYPPVDGPDTIFSYFTDREVPWFIFQSKEWKTVIELAHEQVGFLTPDVTARFERAAMEAKPLIEQIAAKYCTKQQYDSANKVIPLVHPSSCPGDALRLLNWQFDEYQEAKEGHLSRGLGRDSSTRTEASRAPGIEEQPRKKHKKNDGSAASSKQPERPARSTSGLLCGEHSIPASQLPPPAWVPQVYVAWASVLARYPELHSQHPAKTLAYHLPPPHLFFAENANTGQRFHGWLRIRPWCIKQVLVPPSDGKILMATTQWRIALEGKYVRTKYNPNASVLPKSHPADMAKLPPPSGEPPSSAVKRSRDEGEQDDVHKPTTNPRHLKRYCDRLDISVRFNVHAGFTPHSSSASFTWGKERIDRARADSDRTLWAEIVWELSILDFRFELLDLDREMVPHIYLDLTSALKREDLIKSVWSEQGEPGMGQSSLDPLTVNGGQPVDSGLTAV